MTEELCHIANRHEPPARACLPKNQMEVLMKKLLKLPLRIATLPLIAILLVFQLISSVIVGLTSMSITSRMLHLVWRLFRPSTRSSTV